MFFFIFNRTTLQVFVTYLTGALYVHPLWFYKHQRDYRVRSKLFVACQLWWFQWRFWFVPSVPGYLREGEEHKPDPWRNLIERNHMGLHLENGVLKTPTIILNNPVYVQFFLLFACGRKDRALQRNLHFRYMFIHSLVFSLRGRVGRNQSPVMWTVWLWHTASWASSWG